MLHKYDIMNFIRLKSYQTKSIDDWSLFKNLLTFFNALLNNLGVINPNTMPTVKRIPLIIKIFIKPSFILILGMKFIVLSDVLPNQKKKLKNIFLNTQITKLICDYFFLKKLNFSKFLNFFTIFISSIFLYF